MIAQNNYSTLKIKQLVQQTQNLQKKKSTQYDKLIMIDNDFTTKQIQGILNPQKLSVADRVLSQNVTAQQLNQFSMLPFLTKFYRQLFTKVLKECQTVQRKIDGTQDQQKQKIKISRSQQLYAMLQDQQFGKHLDQYISKCINLLQKPQQRKQYQILFILSIYNHVEAIYNFVGKAITPSTLMMILLNQYNTPVHFYSKQPLQKRNALLIQQKLTKQLKDDTKVKSSDVLYNELLIYLKNKFKIYKKIPEEHWRYVDKQKIIQRYAPEVRFSAQYEMNESLLQGYRKSIVNK